MTADVTTLASRRGRRPHAFVARRVLLAALSRIREGALELRLPDGAVRRFGDAAAEPQRVDVLDDRLFRRLALRGKLGPGESYAEGEWRADDLVGFLSLMARNGQHLFGGGPLAPLARVARALPRPHLPRTLQRAERDVHAHYDLGNAFFSLWLDPSLTYSSALFERADQTLADAQQAKYRHLCDVLALDASHHLLEIGSGWGGMAVHAASQRGCRVTTVTISREQHAEASRRVAEAGLSDQVDVLYRDYRTLTGRYDRVVSIEMVEAIGHRQLPTYLRRIDELLAPDGLAALQAICIPEQHEARYRRSPDWIRTYIFPGGLLPSVGGIQSTAARTTSLMVHRVEEIGPHYARTLREWRERFLATRAESRGLGLDDRFLRMWEYYLAFCEAAFATHALRDVQLVLTRPMNRSVAAGLA